MYSNKPKRWILYPTVPLMIGLFVVGRLDWAEWAKTGAAFAIVICTFAGMALWMEGNQSTIQRAEYERERRFRAKLCRKVFARRSQPIPVHEPVVSTVPSSGFGSARFKLTRTYKCNRIAPALVRLESTICSSQGRAY